MNPGKYLQKTINHSLADKNKFNLGLTNNIEIHIQLDVGIGKHFGLKEKPIQTFVLL